MRSWVALLSLYLAAPPLPLESSPYALDPGAAGQVLVHVRADRASSVDLAWDADAIPPGWVAPRAGLVARPVPRWRLGGPERRGQVFHGSASVRRLSTPGGDGLLMIRVVRGP